MEQKSVTPVVKVIHTKKGLARKIAAKVGITPSAVYMWKRVPPRHAAVVSRCLRISMREVCPQMFPVPRARKKKNSTRDGNC